VITCLAPSASLDITYLVEEFQNGAIHRPREVLRLPGGKALNVARALVSLGAPARAIVPLAGHMGALVEELLAESGVDIVPIEGEGETRSCVTVASDRDGLLTEIYEQATPVGPRAWAAFAAQLGALRPWETEWLALAGSVPADVDLGSLAGLLLDRREAGIPIAIDTHGEALAVIVDVVRPDLVKVNRSEAAALVGLPADGDLLVLAEGIRARTGGMVIVTDGVAGSMALDSTGATHASADSELGQYSVGSGDSFLAGLLAGLTRGDPIADALVLAAACASANAAIPGAALFDLATVEAARARITLQSLRRK
jgi:1-phosphofructokinase family hexose kinase